MTSPDETNIPANSTVTANVVHEWLADDSVLLIDVREAEEHADEHIPGAVLLPLSTLDAADLPKADGRRRVLLCLSGKRSAIALAQLAAQGVTDLLHLDGGLLAFKAAGGRTFEADEPVAA